MAEHTKTYQQSYRVADTTLEQYELYVGEGSIPDFDASDQPVATGASFPISWTPPTPGSGATIKLYAVTRKRNRYNLLSHNQYPTIIEINDLGEEELGPITDPEILNVIDGVSGEIKVFARYPLSVDRNEADTWELYVEEGVDPDPDLDTPVVTETFGGSLAEYNWTATLDGLTPGLVYHCMVVVRRSVDSGDGEYGESVVVEHTAALIYNIDAEDASLFGGQEYEIGQ